MTYLGEVEVKKVGVERIQEIELSSEPSQYDTENDWWNIIYIMMKKSLAKGIREKKETKNIDLKSENYR